MNVYGQLQEDRLADAVEKVAESILPQPKCVSSVYWQEVVSEQESATPMNGKEMVAVAGSIPTMAA